MGEGGKEFSQSGDLCALLKVQISVKFSFPLAPPAKRSSRVKYLYKNETEKKYIVFVLHFCCTLVLQNKLREMLKQNTRSQVEVQADFVASCVENKLQIF